MKKHRIIFILVLLLLFPLAFSAQKAYAFGGCEENCLKCHSFEKSEAQEILKKLKATDTKVLDIKMSPIKGLWEVSVEDSKGMRGIMYVGFSKKYVMGGTIFEVDGGSNKTQESLQGANNPPDRYVDPASIALDDALVLGDKTAKNRVIVFTDPD